MEIRKVFTQLVEELFDTGEILKAQYLVNNCIPLDIKNNSQIVELKDKINNHIDEIKKWSIEGRPYPGTYAIAKFETFPKFVLAKKRILEKYKSGKLLDVGCYSGVFIDGMSDAGFGCLGVDVHKELIGILQDKNYGDTEKQFMFSPIEHLDVADNESDIVTAFDVLEHVIDLYKAISEIERVCKPDGMIIINLPRMTVGYRDESHEHLRMFDDDDINRIWGHKKDFKFEFCEDEFNRPTSFITYAK